MVLVVVAAAALGLALALVRWLAAHWWVLLAVALLVAVAGGLWLYQRIQRGRWEQVRAQGLRYAMSQLDALHHREFEHAVRDLMKRDGCRDARQVGGAGDNGADVTATDPYGRRWVIQCKHRRDGDRGSAVGTPDLHVLNGTARQLHGADVVVLVTNGRFSSKCPPLAKSQRLHLVDRRVLGEWAAGGRPLWDLLRAVPPPRGPSRLS
ncbi:restriction endonuclease [Streptomyces xanthochromogenes]|uniref:restriction endonuclease n=1 Tax=Streptomyces xanthochromogenes TaxID=67384 RepID=UPI00381B4A75